VSPLALAALALLAPAPADVYFEQTVVTATDGRAAGPGVVSQVWYSGKKMRMEAGGVAGGPAFILRLDRGKAYRVDPEARTVTEIDAEALRAQSQLDLSMAGDLMGGADNVRTTRLERDRSIAGYACKGYRIAAGSTAMEVYVTRALPVGIEAFADFLEWTGAEAALGGVLAELRKLPGFPLETRTRVSVLGKVHETLSTVTAVKLGPQPAALFEPPGEFRLVVEEPEDE
jgi:hypothetical protein